MCTISSRLTSAQQRFLSNYLDMLAEIDNAIQYVSECYIKDDHDIGDRLLRGVIKGLLPYNEENMTIQSIFQEDETAYEALSQFQEAAKEAVIVEEVYPDKGHRMIFLHEKLIPRKQAWKQFVEKYHTTH